MFGGSCVFEVLDLVEACLFFALFGLAFSWGATSSSGVSSLILLSVGVNFLVPEPVAFLLDVTADEIEPPFDRLGG